MYDSAFSEVLFKKLKKLKTKDISLFNALMKKIDQIKENPYSNFKPLRHDLKGFYRVHIGHFVLIFSIDKKNKKVIFEDFDHHDKIYKL